MATYGGLLILLALILLLSLLVLAEGSKQIGNKMKLITPPGLRRLPVSTAPCTSSLSGAAPALMHLQLATFQFRSFPNDAPVALCLQWRSLCLFLDKCGQPSQR
ncbi:hypothetical protein Taro_047737 [Colocasia esculenta]|uniref:Uncharacterized protein n=1 Tax=Colocasia esculenta TaxID=4460 RepID=A0A843X804_COLES|nr:hypothetical protein [Colocasia esculenta]